MKKLGLLFSVFLFAVSGYAAPSQADAAFDAGNFAQALKIYQEELPQAASDAARYKVQLRITACQYMLGQYAQAAKTIYGYSLPSDPLWKARFLLYRIQTGERVKNIYAPLLPQAQEENASGNLEKWTAAQWQQQITQDYQTLWSLKETLAQAPIAQETLILSVKDTDEKRIPTLFDFVLNQWKNYLASHARPAPLAKAEDFLAQPFAQQQEDSSAVNQIAALLKTGAELDGKNRQNAKLFWRTDLILLPFDYPQNFSFKDQKQAAVTAAKKLDEISGFTPAKRGWFGRIKGFVAPEKATYGKAYAAYRSAQLYEQAEQFEQSVAVCNFAAKKLDGNYYAKACANLAADIQAPSLTVTAPVMNQNPQDLTLKVTARNIGRVYLRIYPITRAQLQKYSQNRWNKTFNSWNHLTVVNDTALRDILSQQTPLKSLSGQVEYPAKHAFKQIDLKLPELESGFYVIAAAREESFDPDTAPVAATVLNVTDLALFVSAAIEDNPDKYTSLLNAKANTYTPNIFRIYAVNLKTGQPVEGAELDMFTEWKGTRKQGKTDENGLFEMAQKITVNAQRANNSYFVNPLAVKGKDTAFTSSAVYFHFNQEDPVRLFAQTDRAIYRPGQKVQFSVNAFENVVRGLRTLTGRSVRVEIRDANYAKIYSSTLDLNDLGTAAGAFSLPQQTLLGNFTLQALVDAGGRTYRTYAYFKVEDYKRPDYQVTFDKAANAFEYGKTAEITADAQYYFGAPLQKAQVKYTIYRTEFIPPFFWWMPRTYFFAQEEFVSSGTTQTDDKGSFKITFTPQAGKDASQPARYTVKTQVFDESGRVIEAQETYQAAEKPHFFDVQFTQGFFDVSSQAALAQIKLTDINANPVSGKVTAKVYRLENKLDEEALASSIRPDDGSLLDRVYANNKAEEQAFTQELDLRQQDQATLHMPALPEGIYRLTLSSPKAKDLSLVFLVAQENSSLQLPPVAISQHAQYYPGAYAKFLIGAGRLTGPKQVEIYAGKDFLVNKQTAPAGVNILTVPVENEYRGGVGVRWFGASNYQVFQNSAFAEVPYDNKKLNIQWQGDPSVLPGERVNWSLSAKDVTGAPVQGQASITVYDKSLDYYAKPESRLTLDNLFPELRPMGNFADSLFNASVTAASGPAARFTPPFEDNYPLPLPQLNLNPVFRMYKYAAANTSRAVGGAVPMMAAEANVSFAQQDSAVVAEAQSTTEEAGSSSADTSAIRTDFRETAFFSPVIPVKDGKANISFTMPQALSEWNILGFVLTRSADLGTFTAQAVTRKDFMVRLQLPRFLREGDQTTLQAAVTNLSSKKITAEVELSLRQNGLDANKAFGIKKAQKTVTARAGETVFVSWEITVPAGPEITDITATARCAKEADGESKSVAVLPGRERLLASVNKTLKEGKNTLQLTQMKEIEDALPETAVLQINPSLALSVFNSVPNLLVTKQEDLISLLNQYVPLAVINRFYAQYPEMKQAVSRLPARSTVTPAWDAQDPLRQELLSQTPWLNISQGRKAQEGELVSLFEPETLRRQQTKTLTALKKYQNANGAFSWLPGGRDDEYLTLVALDMFAQALSYGAEIPQDMAKKAYAFAQTAVARRLGSIKTPSTTDIAYTLYAAYVLSAFPAQWNEVQAAQKDIRSWAQYAEEYSRFMTPLGQIYAANIFHRLNDDTTANKYLNMVLDRLQENELTGAYFAPEAQSWIWYNDTLSTQTVTLQTLLEMRPEAEQIAPMVRWLLFNRQANEWSSPRAASQAVFTLLNYMSKKGLMNQDTAYSVKWGPVEENFSFKPFDWTEDPRYVRRADVDSSFYQADITKQGGAEDFASLSVVYTTARAKQSPKGVINVSREYFLKYTQDGVAKLRRLEDLTPVKPGDEVEVRLTVTTDSAFEYVLLSDPKPTGFENDALLSGWTGTPLTMYQEYKDAATNFYINWLPAGTVTLSYTLRPATGGEYHVPAAKIQSMYAPQFGANSRSELLRVD